MLRNQGPDSVFSGVACGPSKTAATSPTVVANADGDLPISVLDGLTALADQSLLQQEDRPDGERHFVFFETIREYAWERLTERGEEHRVRAHHAASYLAMAAPAGEQACPDQGAWLDRLDSEHGNLRAVLEWFVHNDEVKPALRLIGALWKFWHIRSHQTEGRRWITVVLGMAGSQSPRERAQALYGAGWLALDHGDRVSARAHFDQSLALFRQLGDVRGVADALHGVGMMVHAEGDDAKAITLFEESLELYRELGDEEGIAWSLDHLGAGALSLDDYGRAQSLFAQSIAIFRRLRQPWGTAIAQHHQGLAALARGDVESAQAHLDEALGLFRDLDNGWGVVACLVQLGYVALAEHDHDTAEARFRTSLTLSQSEDDSDYIAGSLVGLASTALAKGHLELSARLFGAYEAFAGANRVRVNPFARRVYDRDLAVLRTMLDPAEMSRAWYSGHAMSLRQAIALALAPLPD
jgi:non-specific serine/threonine protein kinase